MGRLYAIGAGETEQLIDALVTKYGDATLHGDTYTWHPRGMHVHAQLIGGGQLDLVIER